jgi:hypothetical protein
VLDGDGTTYVEVPTDDYRSIRRAILNIEDFEADYASRLGTGQTTE